MILYVLQGNVTAAIFSPNGRYIATAGAAKEGSEFSVVVWDTTKREVVEGATRTVDTAVTSLVWHPSENSLMVANADGFLQGWEQVALTTVVSTSCSLNSTVCSLTGILLYAHPDAGDPSDTSPSCQRRYC